MSPFKKLYVSATRMDAGKTTLMIGLLQVLRDLGYNVGYLKPVGQHYVMLDGQPIDEDAVLARHAFALPDRPIDMSPLIIERGFTEHYIFNRDPQPLEGRILAATARIEAAHDLVAVEGTGHAGVGSCCDLSNARVAQLMNAAAVIITDGGIGRAIDEVALSLHLFARHGVPVLGVILNRTWPEKLDKIERAVDEGLRHLGTRLIGVVPFRPLLIQPRMEQIAAEVRGRLLCGSESLENRVERTVIAAMSPDNLRMHLRRHTLVITGGDRVDNILTAAGGASGKAESGPLSGLILTGGLLPPPDVVETLKHAGFPVLLCDPDTYTVASQVKSLQFKLRPQDTDKIEAAKAVVRESIHVPSLVAALAGEA